MVSISRWTLNDIWHYGRVNIDEWTETYNIPFYFYYTGQWPDMGWTVRNNNSNIVGYIIGQAKTDKPEEAKGHVTAVTICEEYRRIGIATLLMNMLERVSDVLYKAQFVDLYVRMNNFSAQTLYKKMGYILYRQIINYYETIHEDGFDMRKSMPRDTVKKFMIPIPHPVSRDELDWQP